MRSLLNVNIYDRKKQNIQGNSSQTEGQQIHQLFFHRIIMDLYSWFLSNTPV